MYVYLSFGENWITNMVDMAKSLFLQFFLFLFFSLNPCISKTVIGTGLKFCTQVGSDDLTCNNLSKCCKQCSLPVNNNKATPVIHYKGEILLRITGYP